jgi:hypothetical protein
MALDDVRQALLDVFCHCYGLLLEHLDSLDRAVSEHQGWSGYRLIRECVDTSASRLGSTPLEATDRQVMCKDLLRRIQGAMQHNFQVDSSSFAVFSDCMAAAEATSDIPCVDLTEWQCVGEKLSRSCYCCHLPANAPTLCISVESVDLVPSAGCKLYAVSQKAQSRGEVTFGFAADRFTFADYVNLPFFFLHEYFSHLHSAPMFAEHCGLQNHPFTEGWLLYCARLIYQRALFHKFHSTLCHPVHRDHYMVRYLQDALDEETRPMICKGYALARQFAGLVGEAYFEQVTLLVAGTPYDIFTPLAPDLHGEFVLRVQDWLRQTATLSPHEREDRVAVLDKVLDGTDPVRGLMEWLIH